MLVDYQWKGQISFLFFSFIRNVTGFCFSSCENSTLLWFGFVKVTGFYFSSCESSLYSVVIQYFFFFFISILVIFCYLQLGTCIQNRLKFASLPFSRLFDPSICARKLGGRSWFVVSITHEMILCGVFVWALNFLIDFCLDACLNHVF